MEIIKLDDTMYHEEIIIVINATEKQFSAYYKQKIGWEPPPPFKQGYFITAVNGDKEIHFIYLQKFTWRICDYGLLAHEILHCVCSVFESIGIGMHNKSEEAWAYYMQHLYTDAVGKIKDKLEKTNANSKK